MICLTVLQANRYYVDSSAYNTVIDKYNKTKIDPKME